MTDQIHTNTILNSRYQVQRILGEGGMGAVYLAMDLQHRRPVAIKVARLGGLEARDQFRREAAFLKRLHHHSLPRVWDYFSDTQRDFLVMEYIPGEDLESLVHRQGPQPEWLVLRWADELLDGLEYLHDQNPPLIHRDIKPGNLKLRTDETLVLVDFGIATELRPDKDTEQGAQAVTPGFSPPEQYTDKPTDARTDIYSVGATLYFLLTGQTPPAAIERAEKSAALPAPSEVVPSISSSSDMLIGKALQLHHEDRWRSAAEMRHAVAYASQNLTAKSPQLFSTTPSKPQPVEGSRPPGSRRSSRRVGVALLLVIVAVALSAAGLLALNSSGNVGSDKTQQESSAQAVAVRDTSTLPPTPLLLNTPGAQAAGSKIASQPTMLTVSETPTADGTVFLQPIATQANGQTAVSDQPLATNTSIATSTPVPTRSSPTRQPTNAPTATRVPTATARPATATPRPPAATATPSAAGAVGSYAAATLRSPANGSAFNGPDATIVFQWDSAGSLGADDYYVLTILFPHEGQTWQDVQWVKGTSLAIPNYIYGASTLPGALRWNVVVMRQTGTKPDGQKDGAEISPRSITSSFEWTPGGGGGGGGTSPAPDPTRPAPPTRVPTTRRR